MSENILAKFQNIAPQQSSQQNDAVREENLLSTATQFDGCNMSQPANWRPILSQISRHQNDTKHKQ